MFLFQNDETKVYFEAIRLNQTDFNPFGTEYYMKMCDGSARYLNLKKTRAYVIVDEDENGMPVFETWKIVQRNSNFPG